MLNTNILIDKYYILQIFLLTSVILLIMVITNTSFVKYEQPFDYVTNLPYYYWVGISLLLANTAFLLNMQQRRESYTILTIITLCFYIFALPVLLTENLRFFDIYLHGAEAFPIISNGHTSQELQYSNEYPLAFIFMAISLIIAKLPEFVFFKLFGLLVLSSITIIIYYMAKMFDQRFAIIASMAFIGANWINEGHFSPQAIALMMYPLVFLSMFNYMKSNKKAWIFISIFAIIIINMSNPTQSIALTINLVSIPFIIYMFRRRLDDKITVISLIAILLLVGWTGYNAISKVYTLGNYGEELTTIGSLFEIKVTPKPNETYDFVNQLRLYVSLAILFVSIPPLILFIKHRTMNELSMSGWFVSTLLFLAVGAFADPVLFARIYLYLLIPSSILLSFMYAYMYKPHLFNMRISTLKFGLLGLLIIFIIINPIVRNGANPTIYVPASIYNSLSYWTLQKDGNITLVADSPTLFTSKYTKAKFGDPNLKPNLPLHRVSFTYMFETSIREGKSSEEIIDEILSSKHRLDTMVVFSNFGRNVIELKYSEAKSYDVIEREFEDTNLIVSTGNVRIYDTGLGKDS